MPKASPRVVIKLGSIARHAQELLHEGVRAETQAGQFDQGALLALLRDPEVKAYLKALDKLALLPVMRNA
jgi:hypothetical protein